MFKLRKKMFIFAIIVTLLLAQPNGYQSQMVNLLNNYNSFLVTENDDSSYIDTYFNPCLNKIESCSKGITGVFNLSLVYSLMNDKTDTGYNYGRTVLFSSGGDSPYSTGGIYLHQVNARGDNYLEFGLSLYTNIYLAKIYLSGDSNTRIGFVWDQVALKVYVDGSLYQTINKPSKRPYLSLNYNPIKSMKILKAHEEKTSFREILFNDTVIDGYDTIVKGSESNYFIGCFNFKSSVNNLATSNLNSQNNLFNQCEQICLNSFNQIVILNKNQCSCLPNQAKLDELLTSSDCSNSDSLLVYTASNIRFDLQNKKLDLKIEPVYYKNPIEIGDPVGYKITNDLSENYIVNVGFNNIIKTTIGNGFVFNEFSDGGLKIVNFSARSLSDPTDTFQRIIQINVNKQSDSTPMISASLNVASTSEKTIETTLKAVGGHPYTCFVNFGDSTQKYSYESTGRNSSFKLKYSYNFTGIYNVTLNCASQNVKSEVNDWTLIYLPTRTLSSVYSTLDNSYLANNFNQMFISRPTNPESEIDLELPFSSASSNLKFTIVDLFDSNNKIDWVFTRSSNPSGNLIIKLKSKNLNNYNDNYFQVRIGTIALANYLIKIEDKIDFTPQIKILNSVLTPDVPTIFEITVRKTSNAIMRIDYGDGYVEMLTIDAESATDLTTPYSFKVNRTYSSTQQQYTLKVFVANHISKQESSINIEFENNLPKFSFTVQSNITDTNQIVTYKLVPVIPNTVVQVDLITIIFDVNIPSNSKTFANYVFDKSNGYSLVLTYKYSSFGLMTATANCSNSIGYTVSSTVVKVGLDLSSGSGLIVNSYANVKEYVYFKININGGTGYNIVLDAGDTNKMLLPWSYLSTYGTNADFNNQQYVKPQAIFNQSGIYIMYAYQKPGKYEATVDISNPFGNVLINFCTKLNILPEPSQSLINDPNCVVSRQNLDLFLNNVSLHSDSSFKIARGIHNTLSVDFIGCNDPTLTKLQTRWVMNNVPLGKSIDYEESNNKYCFLESTNNQLLIEPNQLDFGIYSLKVFAFNPDQPENYVLLSNYKLKVDSSPIIINLNNGVKNIELNTDESLILNFYDNTYDPDSNKLDKSDLQFTFVCIEDPDFASLTTLVSSVKQTIFNLEFDLLTSLDLNLAFEAPDLGIQFFEKDCLNNKYSPSSINNPIEFDTNTKTIKIPANKLVLNQSSSISLQLYVNKINRVSVSQQIFVSQNLSNIFSISVDADFDQINKQLDKLDDLAKKNPQKALQVLTSFVDVVNTKASTNETNNSNSTSKSNVTDTDNFSNLRGRMLNTVGTIVDRIDDSSSMLSAANAACAVTSNSGQMPTKNQEAGSLVIEQMGQKAKNFSGESPEVLESIASSILGATSNTFDAASQTVPVVAENKTNPDLLEPEPDVEPVPIPAKYEAPLELYQCDECEDFPEEVYESILVAQEIKFQEDEALREKTSEIAKRTFNGISGAGTALASSAGNGTNMTKIESKNMALIVGKKNVNDTDGGPTEFKSDSGTGIKMPVLSSVINTSNSSLSPSIQTKMIVSASNPFQSSKGQAQGTIVSLELSDDSGNPLEVNNTAEPFNIRIPSQEPAEQFRAYVDLVGINYHKLYLPTNSSSLHIVIMPEIPGDYYHVYVKYSLTKVTTEYPDEKNYDYSFTSPNSNNYEEDPSGELRFTSFLSNNDTKGNGTYYIGIKLAKLSDKSIALLKNSSNSTNSTTSFKSFYKVRIFSTSCKYWKESTKEWSTDGCHVGQHTTYNLTECLCYHLTTFGTDFYVPPNTIDFSTVFSKFKDLSENAAVFATVISILGVYVLFAIYVRYKDKKDLLKWGATPLADNLPTDNYYYLISVQTGVGKDTGTTSKVGFVLSGDVSDSGVRKLSDDKRKAFKSGSVCNFIMSVEENLGSLNYLRIWHDNSGSGGSKSWYLNTVTVIDLQTNQRSTFVLNDWLAVEKGDGQIDRLIPEACQNDLISFKHLFTQSVKKKFTDNHLWFSVISRPTKSTFTRLQRLSCCMSLLFCTMIANAMFYRSEDTASSKSGVMQIGPIKFTITQLYTSIVSTLIVVPVNLIIVTLFRKAKLKHHGILRPRKTGHIAKQQYWRRVKAIENIELPENEDKSSLFNVNQDTHRVQSQAEIGAKKSIFSNLLQRNKNFEYKRESKEDARNKKQGRTLPYWVIYISWFLVVLSIIVPAFFVILYSLQWGKERANAWLASLFMSFFQSLFIVDPLKVFLITAVITLILRKPDEDDDDSLIDSGDPLYNAIVNKDEEYLHTTTSSLSQIDIREILQSRRSKLTTLKPVDPDILEEQRHERKLMIKLKELIREAASYFAFFIVVLFLSYQSRSKNAHFIHTDLSNTFLNNQEMGFGDIVTREDAWNYIEKVFVPGMYAPVWYNDKKLSWREKLTTENRYAIRVGSPRIRQLRIKENTCIVNPRMSSIISHCRDNYNWVDDDTKDYGIGWKPTNGTLGNSSSTTAEAGIKIRKTKYSCKHAWCYQSTAQTKSAPITGAFTTYKGGGYAVSLGRTLERSVKLVSDLKNEGWLDELTRAVFLEFTVYNPNVNLFASGTLIIEYLSTGTAITYQSIDVFSLYNYLGSFGIIVLVFEIVFVIFIIYFVIVEALKMKKEKLGYLKKFWNLNELIIIVFSIISMAMFIMRSIFTNQAIKAVFESELGEFVNFNTIGLWDGVFNGLSAIVVFCATLKFLKLLRFNKNIGALAMTLRYAFTDLIGFSVTFAIIFMAFTQFGTLVFGTMVRSYKDFLTALSSSFRFALGQFDLTELQNANFLYGSIYFILFILIVIMGVMSMFVTILNEAYEKVKQDLANQKSDMEVIDFFFKSVRNFRKPKRPLKKPTQEDVNISNTSLRVNVKYQDKTKETLNSQSFKSLNFNSSLSQFNHDDSLSLY